MAESDLYSNKQLVPDLRILILTPDVARGRHIARILDDQVTVHPGKTTTITSVQEGIKRVKSIRPELIILDAEDYGCDTLQWIKQVRQASSISHVMLITSARDPFLASRALRAGADACLSSGDIEAHMEEAITNIVSGDRFVTEKVMQQILHGFAESGDQDTEPALSSLSDREMMIFQLIGKGKKSRTIADELGVNIKTVSTHCNNIRRKLQLADNRHLVQVSRDWIEEKRETAPS